MKNKIFILVGVCFMVPRVLFAQGGHDEDPHYEWFEEDQVAVLEDGIYAESNKGMFMLNVVEYDRVNHRYKVLCRCLEDSHLDPAEALSAPQQLNILED